MTGISSTVVLLSANPVWEDQPLFWLDSIPAWLISAESLSLLAAQPVSQENWTRQIKQQNDYQNGRFPTAPECQK